MEMAPFPPGVHKIISKFYELVDQLDPQAGRTLAAEVFTPDGKFIINSKEMNGPEGMYSAPLLLKSKH
jgi:hypothetical protein